MARIPVVGISSYARDGKPLSFGLPCDYVDVLRAAGAMPLILPPGEPRPEILLDSIDALLLSGGGDIHAAAYGGEPHETAYNVSDERDDFEIKLRIQEIAKSVYFQDQLLRRNGFLGIGLTAIGHEQDDRVTPGHLGIRVDRILEGTAAERAGLQKGDLIVSRDGRLLPDSSSRQDFSDEIRQAGPGARMTLGVYRNDRQLDVDITLGQRPVQHYFNPGDATHFEMLVETEARFFQWWAEQFESPDRGKPRSSSYE